MKKIIEFRDKLNSISPSMCLAKWQQVTLHLQTGKTHSCHHPSPHKIPLDEIQKDVKALHNTEYKKQQRLLMLSGKRPEECGYCWKVEDSDTTGNVFSDRITKSIDSWAVPYFDKVAMSQFNENVNPSYLEVSFSNVCNFKCSYCSPEISSKWLEEINHYGPYPTSTKFNNLEWLKNTDSLPILEKDNNPYVDAFWKWWPELYPELKVLRITGGEPLLTKHTFAMLEYILKNPRPDLELNVNSNLCVPKIQFQKFLCLIEEIVKTNSVKSFKLYTSCEATSKRAEYIRYGLNYQQWIDNCYEYLKLLPESKLTIMSTYNALSVFDFENFLNDVIQLKTLTKNVGIDVSYLRWPEHLSIQILTEDFLEIIKGHAEFMIKNNNYFENHEINRMNRAVAVFLNNNDFSLEQNRKDFMLFLKEHDSRRGTDFLSTFPELEEFCKLCR
jgi:organic radical activating enzyme